MLKKFGLGLAIAVFCIGGALAQMKLLQEPAGGTITGSELFLADQGGQTVTLTANQIKTFVGSAVSGVSSFLLNPPAFISSSLSGSTGNVVDSLSWNAQNANSILAGPLSGSAAGPTFRSLTSADLPTNPSFAGDATFQNGVVAHECTMTSGATYTVDAGALCSGHDYLICVNKATGSATAIDLPTSPVAGRSLVIKDCKGDAATNNITVVPSGGALIEGAASLILNINRQSISVFFDGVNWDAS